MESDEELQERLRLAERAAAAPYIDYPPTPWWYPLMMACYVAALVATVGATQGEMSLTVQILVIVALLAAVAMLGAWYRWDRDRRGTWPNVWRPRSAPQEIRRAMRGWFIGAVLVAAVGVALALWVSVWVAAAVGGFLTYLGATWYERVFARAATRVRVRLG